MFVINLYLCFFITEFCGSEKKEVVEKLEEILDDVAKSGQYMYVLTFTFFNCPKETSPNLALALTHFRAVFHLWINQVVGFY